MISLRIKLNLEGPPLIAATQEIALDKSLSTISLDWAKACHYHSCKTQFAQVFQAELDQILVDLIRIVQLVSSELG